VAGIQVQHLVRRDIAGAGGNGDLRGLQLESLLAAGWVASEHLAWEGRRVAEVHHARVGQVAVG
jgi:hypothetical protein